MVRWIFEHFGEPLVRPIRGLHQAAYLLAGLTLASQILALLRDRTFASLFGAGETLDLYYAAFRVPDLVFALVSSLVSAYILIPRLSALDPLRTKKLLSESMSFLIGCGGVICIVLAIYMPQFLAMLYPNFTASAQAEEFVFLARLLLLQPLLLGISGVFASVSQLHRRFTLFALAPVLYNLGIIAGTVFLYPAYGLGGIGAGVILGAIAYVAVNVPVLREVGVMPRLAWPTFATMLPIIRDSVPRSLALGIGSITALVLTAAASRLGEGSVSVFSLASNLESVPLALIGSSYAVAAFPALSEAVSKERREEFMRILSASARHIILWSLVALGLIAVLRAHLVRTILGTGAFDWDATRLTAALLVVLAVGLAAQGLVLLFSRALYAARQSWRPLLYQLFAGAATIGLAFWLLGLPASSFLHAVASILKVSDLEGNPVLLLALATAAGQIFLAGLSLWALRAVAPGLSRTLVRPSVDGLIAAIVGGVAAYSMLALQGGIVPLTTVMAVFIQGLVAGIVGLVFAALALYVLENAEFQIVAHALSKLIESKPGVSVLPPSGREPL